MQIKRLSAVLPVLPFTTAFTYCPFLGPDFPAPSNLSSSTSIQPAISNLTEILEQTIAAENSTYGPFESKNTSFSVEIFSILDPDVVYQYHYSAPILSEAEFGVKSVNNNTIYRVGSLTKLFTVYTFLIEAGDASWDDPITKFVPELLTAAESFDASGDPLDYVAWEEVTIGELASQLAGIGRDYSELGELSITGVDGATLGLPLLNSSEIPPCSVNPTCTRTQFLAGFAKRQPVFASSTTPIYSNVAYQILSYALENITGKAFPDMIQDKFINALNLSSTFYTLPADNSSAIIPNGNVYWAVNLGDEGPAGGFYTTSSDVVKIGRSILESSLISQAQTRRWMKPHSMTSDPNMVVGAPWEIRRLRIGPNKRVVDMYSKSGDITGYSSNLALLPDWNLGFIVLAAGSSSTISNVGILTSTIADTFLPAVENVAREEADVSFSGMYNSTDPSLNSSISITTDSNLPGLGVTSWISNGNNMLTSADVSSELLVQPSVRLYPTNLITTTNDANTKLGFRAVFQDPNGVVITGLDDFECISWIEADGAYWGGIASDMFVFTVDGQGKALSAEPRITRADLQKV